MGELLDAPAEGRAHRLVGLTFDDGYADFVTNAMPVPQRYGFTATAFVLAGRLGGENAWIQPGPRKPLLTAAHVHEIARAASNRVARTGALPTPASRSIRAWPCAITSRTRRRRGAAH